MYGFQQKRCETCKQNNKWEYINHTYLFNLYAEYIMRNAGLEEAQAGIKIARRNIYNLRYVDDTTIMAEMKKN